VMAVALPLTVFPDRTKQMGNATNAWRASTRM